MTFLKFHLFPSKLKFSGNAIEERFDSRTSIIKNYYSRSTFSLNSRKIFFLMGAEKHQVFSIIYLQFNSIFKHLFLHIIYFRLDSPKLGVHP